MARAIHPPRSSRASRSVSNRRLTFGRQSADLAIGTRSAGRARVLDTGRGKNYGFDTSIGGCSFAQRTY